MNTNTPRGITTVSLEMRGPTKESPDTKSIEKAMFMVK